MIVPIRQWTILRPIRVAWRARRMHVSKPVEAREAKPKVGLMSQYCAMLEHQADLMIRHNLND